VSTKPILPYREIKIPTKMMDEIMGLKVDGGKVEEGRK